MNVLILSLSKSWTKNRNYHKGSKSRWWSARSKYYSTNYTEMHLQNFLGEAQESPIKGGPSPPHGPDKTTARIFISIVRHLLKVLLRPSTSNIWMDPVKLTDNAPRISVLSISYWIAWRTKAALPPRGVMLPAGKSVISLSNVCIRREPNTRHAVLINPYYITNY